MFPYFKVFGLQINIYGICAAIGLLAAGFLAVYLAKKFEINGDSIFYAAFAACIVGFLGAHFIYGITNIGDIIELTKNFSTMTFGEYLSSFFSYFGGMVFYGGFLGAILGLIIFSKIYKPLRGKAKNLLDILAVIFPLFHGFGRIGCFFAGCCYGVESHVGFITNSNDINPSINGVTRFPIQLVESLCCFIIFAIMFFLFKKDKLHDKLIYIYMIIYGCVRFIDEFFRGDTYRGFLFGLSTSQWISLILIVVSVIMLIVEYRKKEKLELKEN